MSDGTLDGLTKRNDEEMQRKLAEDNGKLIPGKRKELEDMGRDQAAGETERANQEP